MFVCAYKFTRAKGQPTTSKISNQNFRLQNSEQKAEKEKFNSKF